MERGKVKSILNQIILGVVEGVDENGLTEDKHLIDDFGLQSIDTLQIFLDIMDEFNLNLERKQIAKLMKLGELYDFVYREVDNGKHQ